MQFLFSKWANKIETNFERETRETYHVLVSDDQLYGIITALSSEGGSCICILTNTANKVSTGACNYWIKSISSTDSDIYCSPGTSFVSILLWSLSFKKNKIL